MPHWRSMMDRETLGAWDFYDEDMKPVDRVAEIEAVNAVNLAGTKDIKASRKPLLTLRGPRGTWEKKLLVNVTIGTTIGRMYGNDVRAWVGKRITIYPDQTKSKGGSMVDCVRVRPTPPKGAAQTGVSRPVDPEMQRKQKEAAGETMGVNDGKGEDAGRDS